MLLVSMQFNLYVFLISNLPNMLIPGWTWQAVSRTSCGWPVKEMAFEPPVSHFLVELPLSEVPTRYRSIDVSKTERGFLIP